MPATSKPRTARIAHKPRTARKPRTRTTPANQEFPFALLTDSYKMSDCNTPSTTANPAKPTTPTRSPSTVSFQTEATARPTLSHVGLKCTMVKQMRKTKTKQSTKWCSLACSTL